MVYKPSVGASGGIMLGWNSSRWSLLDHSIGCYSTSALLHDPSSGWKWTVSCVYEPQTSVERVELWAELSMVRASWNAPWCILGDFNVTRFIEDRNRGDTVKPDMELFSDWIAREGLLDIPIPNLAYTWSNMREVPSMAKLNRFLVCPD
ncbi:hypothetical protein QJS10_CPB18g00706 [Acorus calamus]|uniref:Uncharacterized protein n=1 Tax=Acorus calamus TaxID=4465 RepID=A0AAV9CLY7_ACOCL|nr:hypothetical protein QJS10_CPB18g00706 [Acorus calamus]